MLAVVPVRDGVLPAGGAEAVAECGGRCLLIGTGTEAAAAELASLTSVTPPLMACEVGAYRPGAWADALAGVLADGARAGRGEREDSEDSEHGERRDVASVVVLPASPDGRDLAPRLAAALDVPLFAGAMSVEPTGVVLVRAGGVTMQAVSPVPARFVATLQPGVRGVEPPEHGAAPVVTVVEPIASDGDGGAAPDAEVVAVLPPDAATMDLAESKRILGGGAGLTGPDKFEALAAIGLAIGASVGATRVVTDRGWLGHERQIGTTGVVVDPDLYMAFGISGAVQHTSGLGQPKHVIGVNTDPHCPMMQLADLAIVADANLVVEELRAQLVPHLEALTGG